MTDTLTPDALADPAIALGVEFDDVTLPPDFDDTADSPPPEGDYCVICAAEGITTPLDYAGRGRRPTRCDVHKRGAGTRTDGAPARSTARTSRDVEAACAALRGVYEMVYYPLAAITPKAAEVWAKQQDDLDARNRLVLSGDPALARKIVDSAAKGGATALIISHAMAVVPVVMVAAKEIQYRREVAQAAYEATT